MKILVVCQYYYPEPFRITDICESLVDQGHDVTILTGLPNYPEGVILKEYRKGKKRLEVRNGVKIIRCFEIGRGKSKLKLFLNYFSYAISASVKTYTLPEKYDVIFVNQLSPVMMGLPAILHKMKNKTKVLLYCLDLWPDSLAAGGIKQNSFIYRIFFHISKFIYKKCDSILVTSKMFKSYFIDNFKVDNKIINHLPQYAEDLFNRDEKEMILEVMAKDTTDFVFAGNIGDMQSVDTIIKAAKLVAKVNQIKIHIIGDGSNLEYCKKISTALNTQNVVFYGRKPVEEMPKYYDIADAMLITLKDNEILSMTLPGKIQSYMAAGKPIIGAINGETNNLINEAKCGLVCDAEDEESLAKLMIEFHESSDKVQMGINSKEYYVKNFSKQIFISKLNHELKSLEA